MMAVDGSEATHGTLVRISAGHFSRLNSESESKRDGLMNQDFRQMTHMICNRVHLSYSVKTLSALLH